MGQAGWPEDPAINASQAGFVARRYLRAGVRGIALCRRAGVRVVMITGD